VLGLAGAMASLGHQVELLTTEPGQESTEQPTKGLTVHRCLRQWPAALAVSASLQHRLQCGPYELIHHHAIWQRTLHYAVNASSRRQVPLVISPRGMMSRWAWRHRRWKKFLAQHLVHPGAFTAAAGWHATSREEADDIRRLGFTQPVCVAPNGVTIPTATAQQSARDYWLNRCPELGQRRVALYYSRFHAKKRILELIDLWAVRKPRDWLLLVVGIPDGYSIAALQDHARRAGASDHVRFFDGTDTPEPYSVASLYLLPSHSENFGLTIAEALAHGVPVLTTDGTPWSQLSANAAGLCVPWPDFDRSLQQLLAEEDSVLRTRGQRGRTWMEQDFTWQQAAATLAVFYQELPSR
jgi:glycosyltransferase involved in cell wall biosynthesis